MKFRARKLIRRLQSIMWRIIGSAFILFMAYDFLLLLVIKYPPPMLLSYPLLYDHLSLLHQKFLREPMYYNPQYAHYDPASYYRLNSGHFTYTSQNASADFQVNSLGLRDDESSLAAPEIIVLGNGQSMGLGVNQQDTLAQIIEKRSRMKTLNAALPGYGTVRSLKLLSTLDLSNLRYLILQIGKFDAAELKELSENGFLQIPSLQDYENLSKESKKHAFYFPGKLAYHSLLLVIEKLNSFPHDAESSNSSGNKSEGAVEAANLLKTLETLLPPEAGSAKLFIYQAGTHCQPAAEFLNVLGTLISARDYPEPIQSMKIINTSKILTPGEDCTMLDEHLNARGHSALAKLIIQEINADKGMTSPPAETKIRELLPDQ